MSNKKGNKKGGNAFSDLSLAGMGKYDKKNAEEIIRQKAAALDARILNYDSMTDDLMRDFLKGDPLDSKWKKAAQDIIDTCEREKRDNGDVLDIIKNGRVLEGILAKANRIFSDIEDAKRRIMINRTRPDEEERRKKAAEEAKAKKDNKGKTLDQRGGVSVFSDLSIDIDTMDKYNDRNAEAHKLKRAAELDERIRKFAAREKDSKWIEEAVDFCSREELANKDIFGLSNEAYRLPLIREEAAKLKKLAADEAAEKERLRLAKIKADKEAAIAKLNADAEAKAIADKLANEAKIAKAMADKKATQILREKEAEEARLKAEREARENEDKLRKIQAAADQKALEEKIAAEAAAEARARKIAADKAKIADQAMQGDELVKMLSSSPRSKFWCDEVDKAAAEINAYPRESRILMKNIPLLEELTDEAKSLREAAVFDKRIERLDEVPQNKRKVAWAEDVLACEVDLVRIDERKLKKLSTLHRLIPIAKKAKYEESIKTYEKAIRDIGSYNASKVPEDLCLRFDKLDRELSGLGYLPSDYINGFDKSWNNCRSAVSGSRKAREEKAESDALAAKKAREAEEERKRREAKEKREREEENAREKIAEEYRIMLATIEGGSFDDSIAEFEAMYKKRSSVGFSLAQRVTDFETRMANAKRAVDDRKHSIKVAEDLRKEAERQAAERERIKKEKALKRKKIKDAIMSHLALIISLSVVVLATGGLLLAGILLPELSQYLIPAAVFVFTLYFVSLFGPIVLEEIYPVAVVISLKSVLAVAGLVFTFMPDLAMYGVALFATLIIGSIVELILVIVNHYFAPLHVSAAEMNAISIVSAAVGAMLMLLNILISTHAAWLVLCIGAIFLGLTIFFLVLTEGYSEFNWIFIGLALVIGVAGFVLMFFGRELALIGLFVEITAAACSIALAIGTYIGDYDESQLTVSIVSLVLTLVLCLVIVITYFSYWGTKDYTITADGTLTGIYVHNDESVLYLPEEVDGITVTAIGRDLLSGYSNNDGRLTTVVIPDTVVSLQDGAFYNCSIATIVLNEGLKTIGSEVFYSSYSTKLGYPENYEIPEGLTAKDLPDNYIPSTVTSIGSRAFTLSSFKGSIVLPEGCTTVGSGAFTLSDFSSVDLSSVTNLGSYLFDSSEVTSVKINDSLTMIPEGLFAGAAKLMEANLPSGITEIPVECFKGCESISQIDIPESVVTVGNYAFSGCSRLNELHLENVKSLGDMACEYVGNPFDIYLGTSFVYLGKSAFWGSTGGLTIHYAGTAAEWERINKNGNFNIDNVAYGY